jgi:cytochrome P450 family 144
MAAIELAGYVQSHFAAIGSALRRNLMGDMAARCATGELDDVTALTMMLTLFGAGGESTSSLLGSTVWILAERPDVQRAVRDDQRLLGAFIEETLRYEPPFRGHYRHVRNATTLSGVALPADSHLLLLWGAANRDPEHFDEPDEFRLDRPSAKNHLTFGKGAHFCVGAALARLEARIVLTHLLDATTWIDAADVGEWLPSILVRRLKSLQLSVSVR